MTGNTIKEVNFRPTQLNTLFYRIVEENGEESDDGITVLPCRVRDVVTEEEEEVPEFIVILADECFGLPYPDIMNKNTPLTIALADKDLQEFQELFLQKN